MILEGVLFVITVSSNVVAVATSVEDACAERIGKGPFVVWQSTPKYRCDFKKDNWGGMLGGNCTTLYYPPPIQVRCVKRTEERWVVEEIK